MPFKGLPLIASRIFLLAIHPTDREFSATSTIRRGVADSIILFPWASRMVIETLVPQDEVPTLPIPCTMSGSLGHGPRHDRFEELTSWPGPYCNNSEGFRVGFLPESTVCDVRHGLGSSGHGPIENPKLIMVSCKIE